MTEREYIETIRCVASEYRELFRKDDFGGDAFHLKVSHWEAIKQKLSPSTAIAMCDGWLAANTATDQ